MKVVHSGSPESRCIALPPWQPPQPTTCPACVLADNVSTEIGDVVHPFTPIERGISILEGSSSSISAPTSKTPWRSSFRWFMEDKLESDWSERRQK